MTHLGLVAKVEGGIGIRRCHHVSAGPTAADVSSDENRLAMWYGTSNAVEAVAASRTTHS